MPDIETESDVFVMTKMVTDSGRPTANAKSATKSATKVETKAKSATNTETKTKSATKTKTEAKSATKTEAKSATKTKNSISDPVAMDPLKTVRLIVDERETDVYNHLCALLAEKTDTTRLTFLQLSKRVLPLGDFILEYTLPPEKVESDTISPVPQMGSMIIERKSLSDLMASIRDGRYEEQSYRLTHALTHAHRSAALHNVVYIIEGVLTQLKRASDRALVHSTMTSLNHFKGFSVLRTASTLETAEYLLTAAGKIQRNLQERKMPWYWTPDPPVVSTDPDLVEGGGVSAATVPHYCTVVKQVKKENITPQNIAEIMLCQLPGISSTTAMAIVAEFPTMKQLMDALVADPSCLNGIRTVSSGKSRRMSQSSIDKVKWCLLGGTT